MHVTALIVAAGTGSRMGGDPKQYMRLAGRPMIEHSYRSFKNHSSVTDVLVVIGDGQEEMLSSALGDVPFVLGGPTRRISTRNGLEQLASGQAPERVLIHDAARPIIPEQIVTSLLAELDESKGSVPFLMIADTVAKGVVEKGQTRPVRLSLDHAVDRSELVRVQTPQAFDFASILTAHRVWPDEDEATDDAQILRSAGGTVSMILGDPALEKVTWPGDIPFVEARMNAQKIARTGLGFDVHSFAGDGPVMMGGIAVPNKRGLAGHSDADVVLHAITDALLGAAGLGDIGEHFPPSDPRWKGVSSDHFLLHAAELIRTAGGIIDHVDCTVICEEPKVGPHRERMRGNIATLLQIPEGAVSIKATTTERLGFTGRGEGIAAQAVASIRMEPRP